MKSRSEALSEKCSTCSTLPYPNPFSRSLTFITAIISSGSFFPGCTLYFRKHPVKSKTQKKDESVQNKVIIEKGIAQTTKSYSSTSWREINQWIYVIDKVGLRRFTCPVHKTMPGSLPKSLRSSDPLYNSKNPILASGLVVGNAKAQGVTL